MELKVSRRPQVAVPGKLCVLLALGLLPACAHHEPRMRASVSAVTNDEVTGEKRRDKDARMHYTVVDKTDAKNHDQASLEHQAMTGTIDRGNAPTPALSARSSSEIASARAEEYSNTCDDRVMFDSNSTALSEMGKEKLSTLAECMKRKEVDHATVVGMSDPIGTPKENQRLGRARAQVVASYLREHGVDDAVIRVESVGESGASPNPKDWPQERQALIESRE